MQKAVLHEFFVAEIQDLYSAETQLLEALPNMAMSANDEGLRESFEIHLQQTEMHVSRLVEIAEQLDFDADGETCEGMEGLIAEGEEAMEADYDVRVKDLALVGAAEKVEQYEMLGYEMAEKMAKEMGHDEAAKLLQETLHEETESAESMKKSAKALFKAIE